MPHCDIPASNGSTIPALKTFRFPNQFFLFFSSSNTKYIVSSDYRHIAWIINLNLLSFYHALLSLLQDAV